MEPSCTVDVATRKLSAKVGHKHDGGPNWQQKYIDSERHEVADARYERMLMPNRRRSQVESLWSR